MAQSLYPIKQILAKIMDRGLKNDWIVLGETDKDIALMAKEPADFRAFMVNMKTPRKYRMIYTTDSALVILLKQECVKLLNCHRDRPLSATL